MMEFSAKPLLVVFDEVADDEGAVALESVGEVGDDDGGVVEVMEHLNDGDDVCFAGFEGRSGLDVGEAELHVAQNGGLGLFACNSEHGFGVVDGDELFEASREKVQHVAGAGANVCDGEVGGNEGAKDFAAKGIAKEVVADVVPAARELIEVAGADVADTRGKDLREALVVRSELGIIAPGFLQGGPERAGGGIEALVIDAVRAQGPGSAFDNEVFLAKDFQVVRNSRLRKLGDFREFVDGEFLAPEQAQHAKACGVGKNAEETREFAGGVDHGGKIILPQDHGGQGGDEGRQSPAP